MIGLVTIGQSPRVDVVPDRPKFDGSGMGKVLGPPARVSVMPNDMATARSGALTFAGGRLARCRVRSVRRPADTDSCPRLRCPWAGR